MNSRERIITAARLGIPDRVPVAPYMGNYGATVAGVPLSQYNTSARKMAEAQIIAWELHGQDVVVAQSDNYYIAQGFGCKIEQPYDNPPHLVKPAIGSLSEVEKLKVPDPYRDGRMYVYIEAAGILRDRFKGEVAVRGPGTGPLSLAGHLMGTQDFLMELALAECEEDMEKQTLIFELLDKTSDALIAFLKAMVTTGTDIAMCGDSLASPDVISPGIYRKYALPFEKKVFDAVKPVCAEYEAVSLLHICGDTTSIFPLICESGADIFECDYKVDLKKFKQLGSGRICLMGNVDPSGVLLAGEPSLVEKVCNQCIADAGEGGGFILGSGCEVAVKTSVENMRTMVNAAGKHKYGCK